MGDCYSCICDKCGVRHDLPPFEDNEGFFYDLCASCRVLVYGSGA